jgi:amino-acid N-acetyltransferase
MKTEPSENITIAAAKQEELHDVYSLLDECELPKEGLEPHLATTIVARNVNEIVGCSALELYQEFALLRSVAVKTSFRGKGLGMRLSKAALDLATGNHVRSVYLLTETAATLFSKIGFTIIPRSEVPRKVQQSVEFTTLCPETATAMSITLSEHGLT